MTFGVLEELKTPGEGIFNGGNSVRNVVRVGNFSRNEFSLKYASLNCVAVSRDSLKGA